MEENNTICTYTQDEMRCARLAQVGSDRCDKHPNDDGRPASADPAPSPTSPSSVFGSIKNLLAIERILELGAAALEWIKKNIPPDIFGAASQEQLMRLQGVVQEQDPVIKRQLASQLVVSLSQAQLLVLLALAIAASKVAGTGEVNPMARDA